MGEQKEMAEDLIKPQHRTILVTAAFPFISAQLHLGHFTSTYVPADVYARAQRKVGNRVLFVSATDVHGIFAKKLLKENQGSTLESLYAGYDEYCKAQFKSMGISFDVYMRTDEKNVDDHIQKSLTVLLNTGLISKETVELNFCDSCKEYLPDRFIKGTCETCGCEAYLDFCDKCKKSPNNLISPTCVLCGSGKLSTRSDEHYFIELDKDRRHLMEIAREQKQKEVKNFLSSAIDGKLKSWDITRNDYLGFRLPFDKTKFVYMWYDSLITYIAAAEKGGFDIEKDELEIVPFIGKNIMYYHGIILPFILHNAYGIASAPTISARGFMSSPDVESIKIEKYTSTYEQDYIRFYLAYKTLDSIADIGATTPADFKDVINNILINKLCSLLKRVHSILKDNGLEMLPFANSDASIINFLNEEQLAFQQMKIKSGLDNIFAFSKQISKFIDENRLWKDPKDEDLRTLARRTAALLFYLDSYIPQISKAYADSFGLNISNMCSPLASKIKINKLDVNWNKI